MAVFLTDGGWVWSSPSATSCSHIHHVQPNSSPSWTAKNSAILSQIQPFSGTLAENRQPLKPNLVKWLNNFSHCMGRFECFGRFGRNTRIITPDFCGFSRECHQNVQEFSKFPSPKFWRVWLQCSQVWSWKHMRFALHNGSGIMLSSIRLAPVLCQKRPSHDFECPHVAGANLDVSRETFSHESLCYKNIREQNPREPIDSQSLIKS